MNVITKNCVLHTIQDMADRANSTLGFAARNPDKDIHNPTLIMLDAAAVIKALHTHGLKINSVTADTLRALITDMEAK
jgi:hypothetical protein